MQNFSFNSTKGIRFGKDISLQTIDEVSGLLLSLVCTLSLNYIFVKRRKH